MDANLFVPRFRLACGVAAVDDELRPGHELGFVARQIDHAPSDVVRFPQVTQRMQACHTRASGID